MKTRFGIVFGLACIGLPGVPVGAQMPLTKVVVIEARLAEAPSTTTLVGTVDAVRRSRVASEIAGIVAQMPAREGDFIRVGETLCRLNSDAISLRLAEAEARLGARTARHGELLAGTRKEELVRLKAVLDEADADYDRWKFEMDRISSLYQDRDSNDKEFYDTRAEFLTAERRKIAARARYDMGVEGPRKESIAQAAYQVAEQQAVVDRLASDLGKTVIAAPFDGYVAHRLAEVGEWIPAGGQVVELVDLSTVLVRVHAPEMTFAYIKVGNPGRIKVDALQRFFEGRVKHVTPQADVTARTFPVEIEIDNREGLLASGMFARVTMTVGPQYTVVAVPKDAVVQRGGVNNIAVVMPGEQGQMVGMLMGVTVGADVADWIAITSGNVKPGTQVIVRGNEQILPFPTPVMIVDEDGSPVASPDRSAQVSQSGGR